VQCAWSRQHGGPAVAALWIGFQQAASREMMKPVYVWGRRVTLREMP